MSKYYALFRAGDEPFPYGHIEILSQKNDPEAIRETLSGLYKPDSYRLHSEFETETDLTAGKKYAVIDLDNRSITIDQKFPPTIIGGYVRKERESLPDVSFGGGYAIQLSAVETQQDENGHAIVQTVATLQKDGKPLFRSNPQDRVCQDWEITQDGWTFRLRASTKQLDLCDLYPETVYLGFLAPRCGLPKADITKFWQLVPEFTEQIQKIEQSSSYVTGTDILYAMTETFQLYQSGQGAIREHPKLLRKKMRHTIRLVSEYLYGDRDVWESA